MKCGAGSGIAMRPRSCSRGSCANPPSSGQGEVTFLGPEAYRSKMAMTTTHRGKAEKMDMDGQGKWLSAECGAIKPLAAKK